MSSNHNAKFPLCEEDEYVGLAMKMEFWITNNDMISGRQEATLRQSSPDDHVADFHYMDDARDIWNAIKARFGGNAESKKMRKSMLKQEFSEFRISESEGLHKGGLPSSWSAGSFDLKNQRWTELLSFDDLYYKLKTLEIISKIFLLSPQVNLQAISHLFSTTNSVNIDKLDLEEMDIKWQMAMLSIRVNKFEKKVGRKIEFDKKEAVRFNKKAVRCYKCLQKGHFARECRAKGGNEKRYSSFKIQELGKKEADTKALITVDTLENWKEHESGDDEGFSPKEYGMVAGCGAAYEEGAAEVYNLITGNGTNAAAGEFALMGMTSEVQNCPFGCEHKFNNLQKQYNDLNEQYNEYYIQVQAYKNFLKTLEKQKRVYQQNQLGYEEKIRVLSIELENTTNLLKHSERINVEAEIAKKDLQTKLDNHLAKTEKWTSSSKNLFRLIDSSMSVRIKVGLGFDKYIGESELGWDDSEFSIFTPKSKETQYANDFDGVGYPQREPIWDNATRVTQSNHFVPQAVLLRSGKFIPAAIPNQVTAVGQNQFLLVAKTVSTSAPVSTSKQNRPPPVHAGRRNSSFSYSGWWEKKAKYARPYDPSCLHLRVSIFRPPHHLDLMFITIKCIMMGMDGQLLFKPSAGVFLGSPHRNKCNKSIPYRAEMKE
ncbi:putative ribonuclease H-like domain-containing protein [Tanacetum coccineum]